MNCKDCTQSQMDCMTQTLSRMDICNLVEDMPFMDIVTCGECEYFQTDWKTSNPDEHYCAVMDNTMRPTDFCSRGEKK